MPGSAVAAVGVQPRPLANAGPEIRTRRRGRCIVAAIPPQDELALRNGLAEPGGLARWLAGGAPGPTGRAASTRVAIADGRELHVRPVVHGGILGSLWRGRVLGVGRACAELRVGSTLSAAGAPVARPALVAGERRRGLWRVAIASWHEADTLDVAAFLAGAPERSRVLRAAAAAGRALRRFHDAGGRHPDLHVGNVLLRESAAGCDALLVDLDRARAGIPPGASARLAELMRLHRSLAKRGLLSRVGARGSAVFLTAYTGSDRALRRSLLRHLPRERRRLALHRVGWRLLSASRRSSDRS